MVSPAYIISQSVDFQHADTISVSCLKKERRVEGGIVLGWKRHGATVQGEINLGGGWGGGAIDLGGNSPGGTDQGGIFQVEIGGGQLSGGELT